jgi:hypothetical protein
MRFSSILYFLLFITLITMGLISGSGCAQIGAPTGGPKDTIPPRLRSASPELRTTNFKGNKITLLFNEYVTLDDVQNNVLVSPFPKINPVVDYKLKTVTVKLKDSLLPNTTYVINFGNAIKDNNEGNILKNFTYVFSTGNSIDSLQLSGKVIIAETGKADSTLFAMLYRNADDSAVQKRKPDYIAKLNGGGSFTFTNLSPGNYKLYALKDGDGGKTYNSKGEQFAFLDKPITIGSTNAAVTLYASAEEKDTRNFTTPPSIKTTAAEKKLKYTTSVPTQNQELPDDLELVFNKPLKKFDSSKIILTDTSYKPISSARLSIDSSRKKIRLSVKWQEDTHYRLIINNTAVTDSSGNSLAKTDTIRFTTKRESDYGNVVLRFTNLDLTKHPVLQFVQADEIKASYPLTTNEWSKKIFKPGEYELRILFDDNNNGKWDPGHYSKKIQPEKVIALPQKLGIRADWDNERDIKL